MPKSDSYSVLRVHLNIVKSPISTVIRAITIVRVTTGVTTRTLAYILPLSTILLLLSPHMGVSSVIVVLVGISVSLPVVTGEISIVALDVGGS